MGVYQVTTDQGTFKVTTGDSSAQPDTPDMSNMFGQNGAAPEQAATPEARPSLEQKQAEVEQMIQSRPTAYGKNAEYDFKGHPIVSTLKALSAPFQAAEAIPAEIMLGLQQAQAGGLQNLPGHLAQDLSGDRVPQIGDVYRASNIPGLSSEPVASTLGLVASIKAPLANIGTNAVGEAYSKALSPVASTIGTFAERYGKPVVANALAAVTAKPVKLWQSLLDNPQLGDRAFVESMKAGAKEGVEKIVNPLQENTSNRVLIEPAAKDALHDLGVFVKPQGIDNATFTAAIAGDDAAVRKLATNRAIDQIEELAKDSKMSSAQKTERLKDLMEGGNVTVSISGGKKQVNVGQMFSAKPEMEGLLEKSAALESLNKSQQADIVKWYKKVIQAGDMSFNEARGLTAQIDNKIKNYYEAAQARGLGINGAQAGQFERLALGIRNSVSESIAKLYPEASKALEMYGEAKHAENVYRTLSTFEPHMFRAFMVRMGLGLTGIHGAAGFAASALASVPKAQVAGIRAISGLSKISKLAGVTGLVKQNPASILSPLLRAANGSSAQ